MIVVDASSIVEVLLNSRTGQAVLDRMTRSRESLHAPSLIDLEVLAVLRRLTRTGDMDDDRADLAVSDYLDLPLARYPHATLIKRVWHLRQNFTVYDASYVALAEAIDAVLLTGTGGWPRHPVCDARSRS